MGHILAPNAMPAIPAGISETVGFQLRAVWFPWMKSVECGVGCLCVSERERARERGKQRTENWPSPRERTKDIPCIWDGLFFAFMN